MDFGDTGDLNDGLRLTYWGPLSQSGVTSSPANRTLALRNKHGEVLVSYSDLEDWIDFKELHACDMLSKTVISTACNL